MTDDDNDLDFTKKPLPVPPPPKVPGTAAPVVARAATPAAARAPAPTARVAAAPPAAARAAAAAPRTPPAKPVIAKGRPAPAPGAQQRRLIASRGEFSAALDELIGKTDRTLRIFDPTLANYGLNTAAREEQLRAFLLKRRSNRLLIVVHDTSAVTQGTSRLLRLLRQFSHAISIHQTHDAIRNLADVLVIADDAHCMRRPHFSHPKGVVYTDDPNETREWLNRFNAIWEQSNPAVSATTVGL